MMQYPKGMILRLQSLQPNMYSTMAVAFIFAHMYIFTMSNFRRSSDVMSHFFSSSASEETRRKLYHRYGLGVGKHKDGIAIVCV